MTKKGGLRIVDSLQGLTQVDAVDPTALVPVSKAPTRESVLGGLERWQPVFDRGRAPATQRAVRADWAQYIAWCEGTLHSPLPTSLEQLEAFLKNAALRGRKRTTLARYLYSIKLVHDAAGLPLPTDGPLWRDMWAGIVKNELAQRRNNDTTQAEPLTTAAIKRILATLGNTPIDLRDAAMLTLASDSLVREAELVRVEVEDLAYNAEGGRWTLHVPRSKTDPSGAKKDYRFVSLATKARIDSWCAAAGIKSGLIFIPVGGKKRNFVREIIDRKETPPVVALLPQEIARIFRRRAQAASIPNADSVSGHSTRVGTANNLINRGFTTAQIMDAGNWKSPAMVALYTQRSLAGQNAVAEMREMEEADGVDLRSPSPRS